MKAPRLSRPRPVGGRPLDLGLGGHPAPELVDRRPVLVGGQLVDQRVLGGQHGVGHAEAGVGPGGEHPEGQPVRPSSRRARDHQVELGPLGAADPVALHGLDPVGPLEVVEGVEQLVGVGGDAEEPLLEVALDHQVARALAGPVGQHLLVGQDRLAPRAPVDRGDGPVGQPGLQQLAEDDLVPADVLGIVAVDLAAPVVDGAQRDERLLQLGDAGVGEDPGVGPGPDGRVFGRQAEGVETDRREHGLAGHGLVPDHQVAEGVVADVALVGRARRVGVHAQRVEAAGGRRCRPRRSVLEPALLPLRSTSTTS